MIPRNYLQKIGLAIVLCLVPLWPVLAQEQKEHKGKPIQVVHTVSNHNYIEYPGGDLELPRILIVDGHWYFYLNTHKAVQSDEFTLKDGKLVPTGGGTISLDLSITSHLVYIWLALFIALVMTLAMARRYKKDMAVPHTQEDGSKICLKPFSFSLKEKLLTKICPRSCHVNICHFCLVSFCPFYL